MTFISNTPIRSTKSTWCKQRHATLPEGIQGVARIKSQASFLYITGRGDFEIDFNDFELDPMFGFEEGETTRITRDVGGLKEGEQGVVGCAGHKDANEGFLNFINGSGSIFLIRPEHIEKTTRLPKLPTPEPVGAPVWFKTDYPTANGRDTIQTGAEGFYERVCGEFVLVNVPSVNLQVWVARDRLNVDTPS